MPVKHRAFVFDFDGTIIDSVKIKHDAYFKIFTEYSITERIQTILAKWPDLNRYDLIKKIIAESSLALNSDDMAKEYTLQVEVALTKCDFIPYAIEVLDLLVKCKGVSVYLSSNTPHKDLIAIVRKRELEGYFDELYGVPSVKDDTVASLLNMYSLSERELIVVGDGESDRKSASINGCDFFHVDSDVGLENFYRQLL